MKAALRQAQDFFASRRRLLDTVARDVSLDFVPEAVGFQIDLETGRVSLDYRWFHEQGYSKEQILWASMHEIGHFQDLKDDPKAMDENFEYIKSKGADARAYHTFYNCFDDIFVNRWVARRAPAYAASEVRGAEVKKLYEEKLFPEADMREYPKHLQLTYYFLRKAMVPDEEILLSEEVKGAIDNGVSVFGQKQDMNAFVDGLLTPPLASTGKKENRAGLRYPLLRSHLEPIFTRLLEEDKKNPPKGKPGKGGQAGSGAPPGKGKKVPKPKMGGQPSDKSPGPFDDWYDDFDEKNPDQIPDGKMKAWQKKKAEDDKKKAEDDNKTPDERAKDRQGAADRKFCEQHAISEADFKAFIRIEKSIEPYLEELSHLWQSIVYGRSEEHATRMAGLFKEGTEMNMPAVIKEWPAIATGRFEDVRVMERLIDENVLVEKPELIRVRLVADQSGSMDDAKRAILKKTAVLMLRSLEEFETFLNITRSQTKSKLHVSTEVISFGTGIEITKPLPSEPGEGLEENRADVIKCVAKLGGDMGTTRDDLALAGIRGELEKSGDLELVADKKIMEIVIEITDGSPDKPMDTKAEVDALNETGVIGRAVQIGAVSEAEQAVFKGIWGDNGETIGMDLEKLPPAVKLILANYLGRVAL